MGCNFGKEEPEEPLSLEERLFVENSFKLLSHNRDTLKPDELITFWSPLTDPQFIQYVKNGCFRKSQMEPIKLKPFAKLFNVVINANVSEKAFYIATRIFDNNPKHLAGVEAANLIDFVASTVRSYFIMLSQKKTREYMSWVEKDVSIDKTDIVSYSEYASRDLKNSTIVSVDEIERWLYYQPMFIQIWKEVVMYLYSHMNYNVPPKFIGLKTLPLCNAPDNNGSVESILSIGNVMFINDSLPTQHRRQWRPLFNSKLHGESFTSFVRKICHSGPTILVVRDENNYVFGGFAPCSWTIGPNFTGDLTAVLFTLQPKMERYITTGYNNHFQYLNRHQQTIPNGLGMGGQYNYWGLWLNEDFITGQTSETCSTFADYSQMSANKVFQIRHIEVWGVGEQRHSKGTVESLTILSERGADKFLLELSGRQFHTDSK